MGRTSKSKTITISIECEPAKAFAYLANPENLPRWYRPFCRSVRREGEDWVVQSPRGAVPCEVIREDRSGLADVVLHVSRQVELRLPLRVLPNGEGAEVVLTLIQPRGWPEGEFHRHLQWAHEAVRALKHDLETARPAPAVHRDAEPDAAGRMDEVAPEAPAAEGPAAGTETEAAEAERKLFVGNLPFDWTDDQLRELFAGAGQVALAEIARFRRNQRSRGFGFVRMASDAEMQAAIEKLNGATAGNRQITVRESRPREERPTRQRPSARTEAPAPAIEADAAPAEESEAPPAAAAARTPDRAPAPRGRRFARPAGRTQSRGIIQNSDYEFFPRGASPDEAAIGAEAGSPASPPRRSGLIEASPYFEDTGDVENRGNRPRGRSRPSGGNRGRSRRGGRRR